MRALPQGRGLPAADWEHRHRGLLAILWLHVVAVPLFGLGQGYGVWHCLLESVPLALAALAAQFAPVNQRLRSGALCLGLLTASGLLVHFSGGFIEFHFHFFVMIALLTLYVDWFPFLLAVGYVLLHHGLLGVLDAQAVYNHADAIANPVKWAAIHAGFVMAAGAASIFTWRISEEESRRRANIERVTEAALAKLPLSELLSELLGRIAEVVDAEIATIWLRQDGGLALRSVHGIAEPWPEHVQLSADRGFHADIVRGQRPRVLTDVEPASLQSALHRACGVRALAGVPLLVEGTLVGVLDVASTSSREFSPSDLDLLQLVADRIGPAIDRARLYEHEHRIAETLQRSLLPKRLPDVPGVELAARYLPAGDDVAVGGDWYDAVALANGRLALVMGDVAGHGSEAAALMGQLRTGLRAYATEGHAAEVVVARLNTLLTGLDEDSMATLLYLELDLESWSARVVNAGHPPPILRGADGRCELVEGPRSAPLGASPFTAYAANEIDVTPGATLVLYTDGLVERRSTSLSQSLDELCACVRTGAADDAEALCREVISGSLGDEAQADDAAVLVVRRPPLPAGPFVSQYPAQRSSVAAVRRRVELVLRSAGASGNVVHDVVTSVSEACANAIQHAYGARDSVYTVAVTVDEGEVVLTVSDTGSWRPRRISDDGGRGIMLMRGLMDHVAIEHGEDGTRVTLRRAVRGESEGVDDAGGVVEHV